MGSIVLNRRIDKKEQITTSLQIGVGTYINLLRNFWMFLNSSPLQWTGAWSGIDTLTNWKKVEHDKIWKYDEKQTQERKNFETPKTSVGVTH